MNLYPSIFRRKSTRRYESQPLPQQTIADIESAIKGFAPLYPSVVPGYRFVGKTKGKFGQGSFVAEAPHFLIISGQGKRGEKPGELESAGFVYQQLALWLDANDIGSVWLGSAKDAETNNSDNNNDIITLAFGKGAENIHRAQKDFDRKPISEITNAPDDICIQAAHLAPSGVNTQPWYFEKKADGVLVYRQKLKPPLSLMYKLSDVDMGIALCHYALACKETGKPFAFTRNADLKAKPGFIPFGVIA
ncbi:MAG: hypothetical protein LBC51_09860 [Treponema sp.]|jgi:hypothetical protein|nr:hypothetical protein [Treponema sp.]